MTKQHSRPCTIAFRGGCADDSVLTFVRRPVRNTFTFTQRAVEHVHPITVSETRVMLQELIQASIDAKGAKEVSRASSESARPTWEQKVNRKRLLTAKCIANYPNKSSAWISRHTKTCLSTVQRTKTELSKHQDLVPYSYNNIRSETDLLGLRNHLATVPDSFETLTDLKRKFPAFSRKRIAKELKGLGLRYGMLPRNRKVPPARKWNSKKIVHTISHVAQVLANPASTMLYCDEIKFPLYQTSKKKWMLKDQPCPQFYNRRTPEDTVITAIALCSTRGFECVQLFTQEITGPDFANFLHYAIESLPSGHQYSILLDNATWHLAQPVTNSKVKPFLHFNEPGLFQPNMIENAFSGCRADFRKRPLVDSVENEARQILNIFFDPKNRERFQGYYRNHLRNLLKYLERHAPKAALNLED